MVCRCHHLCKVSSIFHNVFHMFLKRFWRTSVLFMGPLISVFWTSGDICPGLQNQDGYHWLIKGARGTPPGGSNSFNFMLAPPGGLTQNRVLGSPWMFRAPILGKSRIRIGYNALLSILWCLNNYPEGYWFPKQLISDNQMSLILVYSLSIYGIQLRKFTKGTMKR